MPMPPLISVAVYWPSRSAKVKAKLVLSRPITSGPSHEPRRDGNSDISCELTNLGIINIASNKIFETVFMV